ncbi:MAG TPA: hypothetical protein VFQ32_11435, partial [Ktedonobacterales bacterium]|nr:hypothetical protein [Ktedonobacterales bacterium]
DDSERIASKLQNLNTVNITVETFLVSGTVGLASILLSSSPGSSVGLIAICGALLGAIIGGAASIAWLSRARAYRQLLNDRLNDVVKLESLPDFPAVTKSYTRAAAANLNPMTGARKHGPLLDLLATIFVSVFTIEIVAFIGLLALIVANNRLPPSF